MTRPLSICCLLLLAAGAGAGQTVTDSLQPLLEDKTPDQTREFLATRNQNDPLVIWHQARFETDAVKAMDLYKRLYTNHPQHDYADDALFETAQFNYARGYYITAVKLYQELINSYPKSRYCDKALYWAAASYLATKQPELARTMYEKYLGKYSSDLNEAVHLGIGDSYLVEKEYEKALRAYQMLVSSFPGGELLGTAYYRISECYAILGREDKAKEYLDKISKEFPDSYYAGELAITEKQEVIPKLMTETALDPPAKEGFVVQVGSYTARENADALLNKLKKAGFPGEISVSIINAKQYFRVWIGPWPSRDAAKEKAEQIKKDHALDYFILKK